jgi:hypothetical protein
LKELAEGSNEGNEVCIQRVTILITIIVVNYLKVTCVWTTCHKGVRVKELLSIHFVVV